MRRLASILLVTLLLTGCASKVTPRPTQVAATSLPDPALPCNPKAPRPDRLAALQVLVADYLKGKTAQAAVNASKSLAACVYVERTKDSEVVLIEGRAAHESRPPTLLAWKPADAWKLDAVDPSLAGLDLLRLRLATLKDGRIDAVLVAVADGTGGAGSLVHVSEDAVGHLQMHAASQVYGKVEFAFLRPDLVLVTHRGNQWYGGVPTVWTCNACLPIQDQALLHWDGTRFAEVASRTYSSPNLTANVFLGALEQSDRATATRYVADPALIDQAQKLLQPVSSWKQDWEAASAIDAIEQYNWDALPPEVRKTLPESMRTFTYQLQGAGRSAALQMVRNENGWVVTGFGGGAPAASAASSTLDALAQALGRAPAETKQSATQLSALPLLDTFLATPDGGHLGNFDEYFSQDPRLQSLSFVGSPRSGGVRVVSLSFHLDQIYSYEWLQWRDGDQIRAQRLDGMPWTLIGQVEVVTGPDGRFAVLKRMQRHDAPPTQTVRVLWYNSQIHGWVPAPTAFASFPVQVGDTPISNSGDSIRLPWAAQVELRDYGKTLVACSVQQQTCLNAIWDGRTYHVQR